MLYLATFTSEGDVLRKTHPRYKQDDGIQVLNRNENETKIASLYEKDLFYRLYSANHVLADESVLEIPYRIDSVHSCMKLQRRNSTSQLAIGKNKYTSTDIHGDCFASSSDCPQAISHLLALVSHGFRDQL